MPLNFKVVHKGQSLPDKGPPLTAYLIADNWDDFGFKTFFTLSVYDEEGRLHEIGSLRIGFQGQTGGYTSEHMGTDFSSLDDKFFSLGNGVEYYNYYRDKLSKQFSKQLLKALRDVASDIRILNKANQEKVFGTSLLRDTSLSTVTNQYVRILEGKATLTPYNFSYQRIASDKYSEIKIDFQVEPESRPPTNIHVLIGRNGVGKTTLLNNMVKAALLSGGDKTETGFFINNGSTMSWWPGSGHPQPLEKDYFSGIISVSFSAFDPFIPPQEQADPAKGPCYYYIGLKSHAGEEGCHKDISDLYQDFQSSIGTCLRDKSKRDLWLSAIRVLESDGNFAEMNLSELANVDHGTSEVSNIAHSLFKKMSSGHAIVLLTLTRLIEKVAEKTLILLDEPESHLHPPLLAAFTRALSDLLLNRNGIAIIATHSPVLLQEVPKSCVSILRRSRTEARVDRPAIETFAENVGTLTREVFGLEVSESGFHALLNKSVQAGKGADEIIAEYNGQIGFEGRAIIQSLISLRDS